MATIHAIFENGVFKPTEPVQLPERSEVDLEVRLPEVPEPDRFAHLEPGLRKIYEILDRRFNGGESDAAACHDEFQR